LKDPDAYIYMYIHTYVCTYGTSGPFAIDNCSCSNYPAHVLTATWVVRTCVPATLICWYSTLIGGASGHGRAGIDQLYSINGIRSQYTTSQLDDACCDVQFTEIHSTEIH